MVQLAVKTMAAFEEAVARDGGNSFRGWLGRVIPHIGDAYRSDEEGFRSHMGASVIGHPCARKVWYDFRWATKQKPTGRMLRLWNRGHLEEARFIALLLTIGCNVIQQDENGKQFRISDVGGHYSGSGDGMADGIPDLPPGTRALTEFKTHNDKSFKKLKDEGLRLSKPLHYIQMQQYMSKMGLAAGLYLAVNKNDDEIYGEIITLDSECADKYLHRAIQIIPLHEPPKKISEQPGWFECKWCDHRAPCQLGAEPQRNCRTCEWVEPLPDGRWSCNNKERQMAMLFGPKEGVSREGENFFPDKRRQLEGCSYWTKNSKAFR